MVSLNFDNVDLVISKVIIAVGSSGPVEANEVVLGSISLDLK